VYDDGFAAIGFPHPANDPDGGDVSVDGDGGKKMDHTKFTKEGSDR
jgi:hypothetical protein